MSLSALSTLFVLGVLLHNTEEAWLLPKWSRHAGRWHRPVNAAAFRFAVIVLSALLVVAAVLAEMEGPESLGAYVFFGYVFAMAANAVVPHLVATLALRRYMPGTATGLAFNLPIGACLLRRAIDAHWVRMDTMLWAAPAVSVALIVAVPVLFALGGRAIDAGKR